MKQIRFIVAALLMGVSQQTFSAQGYHVTLKVSDAPQKKVYLVHYYGKPGPTVYISDSANFENGVAEFKSNDPAFVGGIYMMLFPGKNNHFEFLLTKGDDITISATLDKLPEGVTFKNSPENDRFEKYVLYLNDYSKKEEKFKKELEKATTTADTADIRKRATSSYKEVTNYRKNYEEKYPGTLLTNIFKAMETPEVPEGKHYLEDGKTIDTTFTYHYYKSHYWDGFNFKDDRLVYTPIYDGKLEEYMTKMVVPMTDSMEKESDMMLKKVRGTNDLFHYTLWWLTQNFESSKVMGMDEVFVYLIENYYMKGDATWLSNEELKKYEDRAQKISPNVLGNKGPEISLQNIKTKKEESMLNMKAKYTMIVFYSPNCGHCQHEMPKLDSAYNAVLKSKGVKVYTVATEGDEKLISDFITKYHMEEWTNTWDPEHTSDYHNTYDVYSTPVIYLLDDRKIIRGKRLDHSNVGSVIDMLEKKAKKAKEE